MEVEKKYPLPWSVHNDGKTSDKPNSPYSVSVQDSKNKDVFCYVYWDENHEMRDILEFIVSSVNKKLTEERKD